MNLRKLLLLATLCLTIPNFAAPIHKLLERIDPGASKKFVIEQISSSTDFFELDTKNGRPLIRGNNTVSIAMGINWYLKYHAGIHLSWNQMKTKLPAMLPPVKAKERHATDMTMRYAFNYCTFSYTMAFWDWERWEREIDWMALHGINTPLAIVGMDVVWKNVLTKLGYSHKEINNFIAGPAFQAWWLMNNLEGWGGPNPDNWYARSEALQKKIVKRMRELDIHPVFPGYSGMVPANAKERLGLTISPPATWCGYSRPSILLPTDPAFERIANLYYKELTRLYGRADYYSMDPFHEGGNVTGVDLPAAGKAIHAAMKRCNPKAVWIPQAWQNNPREELIKDIPQGDITVLDLFSESRPQWGTPESSWARKNGFVGHNWIFCMLLNYGGNVGLHGKMRHVINEFYKAKESPFGRTLKGVGLTPEGTENNPVMFELLTELPWRENKFSKDEWLNRYVVARYGKAHKQVEEAWNILSNTIYACPDKSTQQGTHESIFTVRPRHGAYQSSSWSEMSPYYDGQEVIRAAKMMVMSAEQFRGNNNFEYDLVDILRQAVAEKGRFVFDVMESASKAKDLKLFTAASDRFLQLLLAQDKLLATRSEFRVGRWIDFARRAGNTEAEKNLYEWNARVQITTWGNRHAAENGGLRDYAQKEWNGLLRDFYYPRWEAWISLEKAHLAGGPAPSIDYYAMDEPWTLAHNPYKVEAEGDVVDTAKEIVKLLN